MISVSDIKKKYKDLCKYIEVGRLHSAFSLLNELLQYTERTVLKEKSRELETHYTYMLKYTFQGVEDPQRSVIYDNLLHDLLTLADSIKEELLMNYSALFPYNLLAHYRAKTPLSAEHYIKTLGAYYDQLALSPLAGQKQIEDKQGYRDIQERLFYHFLSSDKLGAVEKEILTKLVKYYPQSSEDLCLIVGAITLRLLYTYKASGLMLLMDLLEQDTCPDVRQRALVSIALCLFLYGQRIELEPKVHARLQVLRDSDRFRRDFKQVILLLIASRDTERITQKLKDEILPEVMKMNHSLREKLDIDSMIKDGGEGENPEWENLFEHNAEIADKLNEISELQMEGADVFMATFAQLKHFPFFNSIQNWFRPFDAHSEFISGNTQGSIQKIVDLVSETSLMCNSDKYSFCFSLMHTPESQLSMMQHSLNEQLGQVEEIKKDESLLNSNHKGKELAKQYIQDLYRFFKLYKGIDTKNSIFNSRFNFHASIDMQAYLDIEQIKGIAHFYFQKRYYLDARELYEYLLTQACVETEILQKLAYCYQKEGDYTTALKYYLRSDLMQADNYWNIRKIAFCYRTLQQYDQALKYYQQAKKLKTDNLDNHIAIGFCLIELGQFEEALPILYEVAYRDEGNKKVQRLISWCGFVMGDFKTALKYSDYVLGSKGYKAHDCINRAHIEWCSQGALAALGYYLKAIQEQGMHIEDFLASFTEDTKYLVQQGVSSHDLPLMIDKLMYELSSTSK